MTNPSQKINSPLNDFRCTIILSLSQNMPTLLNHNDNAKDVGRRHMANLDKENHSKVSGHLLARLRRMRPDETISLVVTIASDYDGHRERIKNQIVEAGIRLTSEIDDDPFITLEATAAEVRRLIKWVWIDTILENQRGLLIE